MTSKKPENKLFEIAFTIVLAIELYKFIWFIWQQ